MRRWAAPALACALAACANPDADAPRVSVMTFNAENLFDAKHDPGKNDYAFLPIAEKGTPAHESACAAIEREVYRDQCLLWDWSERTLAAKLRGTAAAILAVGGGRGPDLLLLQEIENRPLLDRLNREFLGPAGYRTAILLEGKDGRGIDQAILSRLPTAGEPFLYEVPGLPRGVLVVPLRLPDGAVLEAAVVHFPSPASPRSLREAGFDWLRGYRRRMRPGSMMLVGGDFNVTAEEDARYRLFARFAAPDWAAAHETGCARCPGTNYYPPKDSWSFLDTILVSANMAPFAEAPWRVDRASIRVADGGPGQKDSRGRPLRFDPLDGTGVSDHFPLTLDLVKRR